ncbi:hypothetical protein [Neisseria arctica]|nr:hypothetical protein [Neisseria arctica]UOO87455.1 hypothetical protein LVJ86_04220 [Neisseria arctica]
MNSLRKVLNHIKEALERKPAEPKPIESKYKPENYQPFRRPKNQRKKKR